MLRAEETWIEVHWCGEGSNYRFINGFFSEIELARRDLCKGYFDIDKDNKLDKLELVWVDIDQMYFISNTPSLKPGMLYAMDRLIQVDDSNNTDPVRVEFDINKPRFAERYHSRN